MIQKDSKEEYDRPNTKNTDYNFGVVRTADIISELKKLRNDTIYQLDLLNTYKKQVSVLLHSNN